MKEESSTADPSKVIGQILQLGIKGGPGLLSAKELGEKYLKDPAYTNKLERIEALIKWEERKNFTSGFLTSLGGIMTLPIAIPASLGLNWILQTRMVAAMAHIGGFDIDEAPVRMSIALCLLGKKGKEILHHNLDDLESYLHKRRLSAIPSKTLTVINQAIAAKLMRVAAQKGMTRISKAIPLIGGVIGGAIDFHSCKETAEFAKELFQFERGIEHDKPSPVIE